MNYNIKKIGDIIEEINIKNINLTYKNLIGLNIYKEFFPSIANQNELDLTKYKIISNNTFATNLMHVGRDEMLPVALYKDGKNSIISNAYKTFRINKENEENIIPEFLMINLHRKEFDRYCWFISDSSIRGGLEWKRFCKIEVKIPDYKIQKELVTVYNSIISRKEKANKNISKLKKILKDFFQTAQGEKVQLGNYISENKERNEENITKNYLGISIKKKFITSRLDQESFSSLMKHKIIKKNYFSFITTTSRNGEKISIALSDNELAIVSATYVVFKVKDNKKLKEKYLMLYFKENEFDRYVRYHSWGSARETFGWEDMKKVLLHIPDIKKQESIIEIGDIISLNEKLVKKYDSMILKICPIFVKGIN
mgnify:CR=1 FL=1|jgi:type I restriction enzyme S subunit|tara:strand:+ start:627 stop:1733 length:1107 start_codon:yes stop_codon:yes gene_type:complete